MRASDIVNHLAINLPANCDDFTTQISVTSLTRSGTTVTAVTATDHGLTTGKQVNINGAKTPIQISSLTRDGEVGTLVTDEDHDVTENAGFDVEIEGATEAEFNGTFTLISVPNRRTIEFTMADSGATTATGSPLLLNGSNYFKSYNGLREVTATPTTTSFQYEVSDSTIFSPASGAITAKTSPRISSVVDFERALDVYTAQNQNEAWLLVVLGDAVADKNRLIDTDSTDYSQPGQYFQQRLIQSVQLFVFLPSSHEIGGRSSRDRCEELLQPICQSILTKQFPSLVGEGNNPLMLTGHGAQAYNDAVYVHQYAFEATLQLNVDDIYQGQEDVAFRDIDMTMSLDVGSESFNSLIDLDGEIL